MLEYIYQNDAPTSTAAPVEVLKVNMHDRRQRINPFIEIQANEIAGEGSQNGGVYRFSNIMGMQAATRRTAAPTSNQVNYSEGIGTKEVVLTITQPLETPNGELLPTSRTDVVQQDGINFTPIAAQKTANILIDGEVMTDVETITEDAGVKLITYDSAAATPFTEMRLATHRAIAAYYDVSEENAANWTNADVFAYFDAGRYSYEPAEIFVYANPSDLSEMSIELLMNGQSTSDMVFTEFKEGNVQTINGRPVKASRYVPKGEVWISPIGILGRPSRDVIYTLIKTSESDKGDLQTYGKHYYDSILIAPELFTRVIPAEVEAPLRAKFAAKGKVLKSAITSSVKATKEEKISIIEEDIKVLNGHLAKAKSESSKEKIAKEIAKKQDQLNGLKK